MSTVAAVAKQGWAPRTLTPAVIGLAGLGAAAVWTATTWGVGASPDSVKYLGVAQSLLEGHGWTLPFGAVPGAPLTQFPPFYPTVLAVFGILAGNVGDGARWLQAVLLAANAGVVAVYIARINPFGSFWGSLAGAALIVASPAAMVVHSMAWSEGLFIFLGFAALLLVAEFLETQRPWQLWVAGALLALVCLTRLAGVAFLMASILALLLGRGTWKARISRASLIGLVGIAPLTAWLVSVGLLSGSLANRVMRLHLPGREQFQQAAGTMASWLLVPASWPGPAKLAILVLAGLALAALHRLAFRGTARLDATTSDRGWAMPGAVRVVWWFLLAYGLALVAATSFADANIPWDDRLLSPVFIAVVILVAAAFTPAMQRILVIRGERASRLIAAGLALVVAVVVGVYTIRTSAYVARASVDGLGFHLRAWSSSPTLSVARGLPADTLIYSNSPEAIYLLAGKVARPLPRRVDPSAGTPRAEYAAELDAMASNLMMVGGVVVVFDGVQGSAISLNELRVVFPEAALEVTDDGIILAVPARGES